MLIDFYLINSVNIPKIYTILIVFILDFGLVLIGDSTVYLIGGMDPITFETKDTVFIFDLKTGRWDHFPPLNVARYKIKQGFSRNFDIFDKTF